MNMEIPPPICYNCTRQDPEDHFKCIAFPKRIPQAIIESRADHRKPYPGDNGLLYDPIDPDLDMRFLNHDRASRIGSNAEGE
jgi:hypothetical protein